MISDYPITLGEIPEQAVRKNAYFSIRRLRLPQPILQKIMECRFLRQQENNVH